jgi:hypothetical protein
MFWYCLSQQNDEIGIDKDEVVYFIGTLTKLHKAPKK